MVVVLLCQLTEIVACFFILSYFIIQHPALIQALQIFIAVQLFRMLVNNGKELFDIFMIGRILLYICIQKDNGIVYIQQTVVITLLQKCLLQIQGIPKAVQKAFLIIGLIAAVQYIEQRGAFRHVQAGEDSTVFSGITVSVYGICIKHIL